MDKQNAKNESGMVDLLNQETKELQDSQKQIEEMARIIHKHFQYLKSDWEEYTKSDLALAYALKWNGYCKIPEGVVVLTKEEYKLLDEKIKALEGYVDALKENKRVSDELIKVLEMKVKLACKGTVEKIMNDISGDVLVVDTKEYGRIEVVPLERLDEICEEFTEGVS